MVPDDPYRCYFEVIHSPMEWALWIHENARGCQLPCPPVWPFLAAMPPVAPGTPIVVSITDAQRLIGLAPVQDGEVDLRLLEASSYEGGEDPAEVLREAGHDPELIFRQGLAFTSEVLRRVKAEKELAEAQRALGDLAAAHARLQAAYQVRKEHQFVMDYGMENGYGEAQAKRAGLIICPGCPDPITCTLAKACAKEGVVHERHDFDLTDTDPEK